MGSKATRFVENKRNKGKITAIASRLQSYKIEGVPIGFEQARERLIAWLENFEAIDFSLPRILSLLEKMDFIKSSDISEKLATKSKSLITGSNTYIAPLGEETESSFRISANFNQNARYFSSLEELLENIKDKKDIKIILYDDFLNSGGQIITIFKTLLGIKFLEGETNDEGENRSTLKDEHKQTLLNAEIHLFFYKAFDRGVEHVDIINESELALKIRIHRYTSADATDGIFGDYEDRSAIEYGQPATITHGIFRGEQASKITAMFKVFKDVGCELLKFNEPGWNNEKYDSRCLGYGNEARLLITDFNVPTNTITCLWMSGKIWVRGRNVEWQALLPRRKKILYQRQDMFSTGRVENTLPNEVLEFNVNVDYLGEFHTYTEKHFLKKRLNFDYNNERLLASYNDLFLELADITDQFGNKKEVSNIFQSLFNFCTIGGNPNPVMVSASPGSGRTVLMSVLYQFLYNSFKAGAFDKIPIYVNLDHFAKTLYKINNPNFQELAEAALLSIAHKTRNILKQHQGKQLLVLVDGIDRYNNSKVNLVKKIYAYINKPTIQSIAGVRELKKDNSYRPRNEVLIPFSSEPQTMIELSQVNIGSGSFEKVVNAFSMIWANGDEKESKSVANYLKSKVTSYNIEQIDVFILELLASSFKIQSNYKRATNLSIYLDIYFSGLNVNVKKAGQIAHKLINYKEELNSEEKNSLEWWFVHKHEKLKDYFIAKHVLDELLNNKSTDYRVFNFVYPSGHNVFFKEILNYDWEGQNKALQNIKLLIPLLKEKEHTSAKTHLCYLLGRLEDDNIKETAKQFLNSLKRQMESNQKSIDFKMDQILSKEQKKDLLLYRTILISLIFIGDRGTSREYIEQLRVNKYFCNLNRGFHLEYYGDITFDSSEDSLKHDDDIGNYCNTFVRLYKRISSELEKRKRSPMFEVELYTLVSLAQHRQVSNNNIIGESEKRQKIVELLRKLEKQQTDISQPLLEYLEFVVEILERPNRVTEAHLVAEIFKIKRQKRIGWVDHLVPLPESVSDHIYGTFLLACHYLPTRIDNISDYKKEDILNMLLHHDLPEWRFGDINGAKKTEVERKREEKVAHKMSFLGTYHELADVSQTYQLYYDFSHSNHINAKIARDIDKLEMLQQLAIYHLDGSLVGASNEQFKQLKDYASKVETEIGLKIREKILELFPKHLEEN